MRIEEIDKNFARGSVVTKDGVTEYAIPHDSFALYGIFYDNKEGCFARMDIAKANEVNDGVRYLCKHTTGGRLRFATNSSFFKLSVTYTYLWIMSHMPILGSSGFVLFEETDEGERFVSNFMPLPQDEKGFSGETKLPGEGMRSYTLYFPLYNDIQTLSISLEEGARVEKGKAHRDILPILYYGSSITQGGCAGRPDTAYQGWIYKKNNIDYINLGFSGNGKAEDNMVDYLTTIDCSLFVCDYDHNAPSVEYLRDTHYRLYERYRKVRPDTPILFMSKPDIQNDTQGEERLRIIRKTYLRAKKRGDNNVYFLSGKRFYGKGNSWDYAIEGCHPTDRGFARMAEEIYKKMVEIDKKFK
ncbi:MAG: hypothetical protein J6S04_02805 [Clostridia bacterium]|nr:hypothetical protein [Clostridia bacterium]